MAELNVMVQTDQTKERNMIEGVVEELTVFIDDDDTNMLTDRSKVIFNAENRSATIITISHEGRKWSGTMEELAEIMMLDMQ